MKLVVIEGPGKQATIKKYLGNDYIVFASKGHIRDLPEKSLAIDINNNFEPTYSNLPDKKSVISELKSLAKKCDEIYLATDPDREGEAISWHVAYVLGLQKDAKCRITFNEISQKAVTNALLSPRQINYDLVDAQQARRVLDRLVGYKISPILSKRLFERLSAGRVQSVALKLVVDREREILEFKPEEYWTLNAKLNKDNVVFKASLVSKNGKKYTIKSKDEMDTVLSMLNKSDFIVNKVSRELKKVKPQPPFITSSMQQDAGSKLKFNLNTTTRVAQSLYEGVSTKTYGKKALVTYIRTDSTRVSQEAQIATKKYIKEKFGDKYAPDKFNVYASKASAQEGHEAIRPIDISITPESLKNEITTEQYKLYKLIYDRFLASQMSEAIYDTLTVEIGANVYTFKVVGKTPVFDGFQTVYKAVVEDEESTNDKEVKLPNLFEADKLSLVELLSEQKFTKPPLRYTEPSFIKLMENKGIGRPATYAQTVNTLFKRNYCTLDGKYFVPTEIGFNVCDFLCENFAEIMDVGFTADMEEKLDEIAKGKIDWHKVIADFYGDFEQQLIKVNGYLRENPVESDEVCEKCGSKMLIKTSINGKFLGCSNFPTCNFTKNFDTEPKQPVIETDVNCEKCGAKMVIRSGKNGKFLACPRFPECKFTMTYIDKDAVHGVCPDCGKLVVEQKSKKGKIFYGCTGYPKCNFMSWDLPLADKCPNCNTHLYKKFRNDYTEIYCSKKCGYIQRIKNEIKPE